MNSNLYLKCILLYEIFSSKQCPSCCCSEQNIKSVNALKNKTTLLPTYVQINIIEVRDSLSLIKNAIVLSNIIVKFC